MGKVSLTFQMVKVTRIQSAEDRRNGANWLLLTPWQRTVPFDECRAQSSGKLDPTNWGKGRFIRHFNSKTIQSAQHKNIHGTKTHCKGI